MNPEEITDQIIEAQKAEQERTVHMIEETIIFLSDVPPPTPK